MHNQVARFLFLFLFISSTTLTFAQPTNPSGISSSRMDRLGQFIDEEIKNERLHGAVSMIVRKGAIAHQKTYGYSHLGDKTPMRRDQLFEIMSMTKPIVSVAFMMLYEEGHFMLTDPISKYLPQFKEMKVAKDVTKGMESEMEAAKSPITIAHVLSHTAGLSHGLGPTALDQAYLSKLYFTPHPNIEARVNALASMPLVGHPGEQWYYSASPDILCLLIEQFSGMSAADYLQKKIFDPLDMKDTGYNVPKSNHDRVSAVHRYNAEGKLFNIPRQTPLEGNTIFGGTHGLYSSAADYMTFCQMLLNKGEWRGRRYLSRKTLELMTQDHVNGVEMRPGEGFGLGFGVRTDLADGKTLGSEGQFYWAGAYNTYFFIDPTEDMIAILMMQSTPYSNYYNEKFRQLVYQAIVD